MNTLGTLLRVHIFGESHGRGIGCIIDGVPPGLSLKTDDFYEHIIRRKSGKFGTTTRIEKDVPQILSGVFNDITTGSPLTILFHNENINNGDYSNLVLHPRPGHADFTGKIKFCGYNDYRGGGHFSGRITLPLVAAGTIAKKIISTLDISTQIISIGNNSYEDKDQTLEECIIRNDSVGAILETTVRNVPVGWGSPFFNSVESCLSHALFSIPGIRGIEFGSGFEGVKQYGSQQNDIILNEQGKTKTNNAGGINGGISNGNDIVFRVAVKPTSSIGQKQDTFNFKTSQIDSLHIEGRHDVCFALRVPVIVESLTALVLADLHLQKKSHE